MEDVYAHTPGANNRWHLLEDHLRAVARLAREFADAFGAGELAYLLGLWHDLGKLNPKFQEYLQTCHANPKHQGHGPDHKAAGTQLAIEHVGLLGLLIQGHHGGLRSQADLKAWIREKKQDPATGQALERARGWLPDLEPAKPPSFPEFVLKDKTAAEFFLRMLFSTLVDADFLDTEQHRNTGKAAQRGRPISLGELWNRFELQQQQLSGQNHDFVAQARHAMYLDCLAAAEQPAGFFRLAIPTGGGKTRSAMAFALRHALKNNQRRVIVAVPFISITEQTAATYRDLFDEDERTIVLEHHSGADAGRDEPDEYDPDIEWSRLAAENWDAPIVVTTTVQLFESLFANKTSRCRKLHRLARSVIILDEAQALPPHLLQPILDGLRQLCERYGTTVVISTATQPAFDSIQAFASLKATEIIRDVPRWFAALKRVDYQWQIESLLDWPKVADLLRSSSQALAIVNTKKDALALFDALDEPNALHLSTLLCGAHRRAVIKEVTRRLKAGEPCYLISTQVIEAGVDLDFPLVLRAMGPLDSIIQAAGRCNREGKLERGQIIVFRPTEEHLPRGAYRVATDITGSLLGRGDADPDDPAFARRYFQRLFATVDLDRERVQPVREARDYPEIARLFRMIDEDSEDVVVTYGDEEAQHTVWRAVEQLQRGSPGARHHFRTIQPYTVSLLKRTVERYRKQGLIAEIVPGLGRWLGKYDAVRGLTGEEFDRDLLVF